MRNLRDTSFYKRTKVLQNVYICISLPLMIILIYYAVEHEAITLCAWS